MITKLLFHKRIKLKVME